MTSGEWGAVTLLGVLLFLIIMIKWGVPSTLRAIEAWEIRTQARMESEDIDREWHSINQPRD